MGGKQSKNDDFSQKGNFNLQQHREHMNMLSGNYGQPNINIQDNILVSQPKTTETEFKKINRTCFIYKPTITIHVANQNIQIEFEYDCESQDRLEVYLGIEGVIEDESSKLTTSIKAKVFCEEALVFGKKQKFKKEYSLGDNFKIVESGSLIIRIVSSSHDERTQYSLRKVRNPHEHWKVLLEKLELLGVVTQLQNIYKGQLNEECIICLTDPPNTIIEPCNHMCLCSVCCESVKKSSNKCPICRSIITQYKKIVSQHQ